MFTPFGFMGTQVSSAPFIIATGGSITTDGDYKIHTFTTNSTFTITQVGVPDNDIEYLVVGAGGGGSAGQSGTEWGSPGAGGVLRTGTKSDATTTGYPVVIGTGGIGKTFATSNQNGGNGGSSSVFSVSATGGNGGDYTGPGGSNADFSGAGDVSGPGTGGAAGAGQNGSASNGGNGATSSITGVSTYYGGGGGGVTNSFGPTPGTGYGGLGGGGTSALGNGQDGTDGLGGGGSGVWNQGSTSNAGFGGDGVVILRYRFQ